VDDKIDFINRLYEELQIGYGTPERIHSHSIPIDTPE
jgi:hypothetical protein